MMARMSQRKKCKPSEYDTIMVAAEVFDDENILAIEDITRRLQEHYPNAEIIVARGSDWNSILAATPHGYWRAAPTSFYAEAW